MYLGIKFIRGLVWVHGGQVQNETNTYVPQRSIHSIFTYPILRAWYHYHQN